MKEKARLWLHNLIAATISGGSITVLSNLGLAGAEAAGIKVQVLDFKQCGVLFCSGAIIGVLLYLRQSPIPPSE